MAYTSELDKLQRRHDENPDGRNFAPLADAYRKSGDYEKAIQLLEKGIVKHPSYVSAHIVFGRCHMDLQDFPKANESFAKVLELDPENVIALKALGEVAEKQELYGEAQGWFQKLLTVDPMNSDAAEAITRVKGKAATVAKAAATQAAKEHEAAAQGQRWSGSLGAVPEAGLAQAPDVPVKAPGVPTGPVPGGTPETVSPREVPTLSMEQPELEVEHTTFEPEPLTPSAEKLEGIELTESVELTPSDAPLEGLEPTEFDAGQVQGTPESEFVVEDASAEFAERVEAAPPESEPALPTGLPLIMPDEVEKRDTGYGIREAPALPTPAPAGASAALPAEEEGAVEAGVLAGADEVVTETMAELYLRQGHRDEALRVYALLVARNPDDAALRGKYAALAGPGAGAAGGPKVRELFKGILSKKQLSPRSGTPPPAAAQVEEPAPPAADPAPGGGTVMEEAFDAPGEALGDPTRPAQDVISLDAVFGDEARASGAQSAGTAGEPAAEAAGEGGAFSFDQFFGQASDGGAPGEARKPATGKAPPTTRKAEEDDSDQFHQWLRGLKG